MDKDDLAFDPGGRERPMEPELLAMQRVARDLERERDAATAREAVYREALENVVKVERLDSLLGNPRNEAAAQACFRIARATLATPSPAAEALLEFSSAAEKWDEEYVQGDWERDRGLRTAIKKWQRARGEGMR